MQTNIKELWGHKVLVYHLNNQFAWSKLYTVYTSLYSAHKYNRQCDFRYSKSDLLRMCVLKAIKFNEDSDNYNE